MPAYIRILNLSVIIGCLFLFISCTKKTPNEISKDIQKSADTLSHKLNRDVDTIINTKYANDSIFNSVKPAQIDNSKLPSKDFRKNNNDIFSHYNDIKNSLSKDDSTGVQKAVKDMHQSLLDALSESAGEKISDPNKTSSKLESVITDLENNISINKQRMLFSDLTDNLINFIMVYGLYDKTIYFLNCDKIAGAKKNSWLADKKDMNNPYYGKDRTNEKSIPCINLLKAWKFD